MIKELLYEHCESYFNSRLKRYKKRSNELFIALNSETKSSAGDKHETGRSMIQLEREKSGEQIKNIEKEHQIFSKINKKTTLSCADLGSVVITGRNRYFISVSAGKYIYNSKIYYCISSKSPIGSLMLGKKVGDLITFNNIDDKILEIL
jgi:hypothetical protein